MERDGAGSNLAMDSRYWDRAAAKWDEEIFSSYASDRDRVILAELKKAARGRSSVADFGCGVGIYLPVLSRLFAEVHGFEQSGRCVALARRRVGARRGITVHEAASAPAASRGRFDAAICVNAAIHPSKRVWRGVLRSACALLKPRGKLVVVVPALESAGLVSRAERHPRANGRSAAEPSTPLRIERGGIVSIEGVRTKHFRRDELADALAACGIEGLRIRRVAYSWQSQAVVPPPSLRHKRPWDWIAVGTLGG